jgi:hypothetical protein
MYQSIVIPVLGDTYETTIENFQQKQQLIGGLFDVIVVTRVLEDRPITFDVWVDDEGLLKELPLNTRASVIAGRTVVGPAVITGQANANGDCTSVTDPIRAFVAVVNAVVQAPDPTQAQPVATLSQEHS